MFHSNVVFCSSPNSPETVIQIESWMNRDPLEIYACIFLLYDNVDTALECIQREIQTCRRHLPVLDSVLFKLVSGSIKVSLIILQYYFSTFVFINVVFDILGNQCLMTDPLLSGQDLLLVKMHTGKIEYWKLCLS